MTTKPIEWPSMVSIDITEDDALKWVGMLASSILDFRGAKSEAEAAMRYEVMCKAAEIATIYLKELRDKSNVRIVVEMDKLP